MSRRWGAAIVGRSLVNRSRRTERPEGQNLPPRCWLRAASHHVKDIGPAPQISHEAILGPQLAELAEKDHDHSPFVQGSDLWADAQGVVRQPARILCFDELVVTHGAAEALGKNHLEQMEKVTTDEG